MKHHHPDPQATRLIQDYLDGALASHEARAFEERLAVSPDLRAEVEGWRVLYGRLNALPHLDPPQGFADRVMVQLPSRAPLRARLAAWIGARRPLPTSPAGVGHPSPDRLQDFVEGVLALPTAARVEAHLGDCPGCRDAVVAWREVMGSLDTLPPLSPSAGFADRVMAALPHGTAPERAVAIRPAAPSLVDRIAARARALVPSTRRGWGVAAGLAGAPAAAITAVVWYVMTHPLLTPSHLASFAIWRTGDRLAALQAAASGWFLENTATLRAFSLVESALASPALMAGGLVTFCLATVASLWVLWRFLLTTPQEGRYVHASA